MVKRLVVVRNKKKLHIDSITYGDNIKITKQFH